MQTVVRSAETLHDEPGPKRRRAGAGTQVGGSGRVETDVELVFDHTPGGRERAARVALQAVKDRMLNILGPDGFNRLALGHTKYITFTNREVLRDQPEVRRLAPNIVDLIMRDASQRSPLEQGTSVDMIRIMRSDGKLGERHHVRPA